MNVLDPVASELARNVEEQCRIWQRMIDLSRQQLDALSTQDAPTVHAVLQEIELTLLERGRAEVRRGVLIQQAAGMLNIAAEDVTRAGICAVCSDDVAADLNSWGDELVVLLAELESLTTCNQAALQQELDIIDILVQGATLNTRTATPTYSKLGQQTDAPRLRLLDAQV